VNSKTAIRNTPDVIRPFDRKQGQADGNLF
jgi:hypothetical protein